MNKIRYRNDALALAIAKAGNITRLAEKLGLTNQAVCKWRRVPAERVLEVERITGVSRYSLRPDIYGSEPTSRPLGSRGNGHAVAA